MREVKINIADRPQTIQLGRVGENNATKVLFDISDLVADYGDGYAELLHQRAKDAAAYPVGAFYRDDDDVLWWVVSAADTQRLGRGECQLHWYVDDALAKSVIYPTNVDRALDAGGETPPEPAKTWFDALAELKNGVLMWLNDAKAFLANLTGMLERGELNGKDGEDGYTPVKGVDYFDGANGKDGLNGKDGEDGYTPVKGVDYDTPEERQELEREVSESLGVDALKATVKRQQYAIDNLKAAAEGVLYRAYTDDSEAYSKDVPVDVLPWAMLDRLEGKTMEQDGVSVSADVESVVSGNANLYSGAELADAFQATGAISSRSGNIVYYSGGNVDKKIIFSDFKPNTRYTFLFVRSGGASSGGTYPNVQVVYTDGTSVSLPYFSDGRSTYVSTAGKSVASLNGARTTGYSRVDMDQSSICEGTKSVPFFRSEHPIPNEIRNLPGYGTSGAVVDLENKTYTAPDGTQTDISELLTEDFGSIRVESGGVITFRQVGGAKLPVQSAVSYLVKLGGDANG